MPEPLTPALARLRPALLDPERLVRAVAAGRRRDGEPDPRRAELRPVDLKAGRRLQVVADDGRTATTENLDYGPSAERTVDRLLAQPFGNWHVETVDETVQLRVTKRGEAQVHRAAVQRSQRTGHDRSVGHLLAPDDPLFGALGAGADKRRQVDAFLRVLVAAVDEVDLPDQRPLRVVDLGCGNAYLTFAAYRLLRSRREDVELVGVDRREQARKRNSALAATLGWSSAVRFVSGTILDADVEPADVVLALHACDTATDEALARAVRWGSPLVLASPCCHHDIQRQLDENGTVPEPYGVLARHGILRERLADLLTDGLRAALVRRLGYRVEVVEFVGSRHTPRNTLIRAVRTGAPPTPTQVAEYRALTAQWGIVPHLATLLADELADELADGPG